MNKHEQLNFAAFLEQLYQAQASIDSLKKQLLKSNNYSPNLLFDKITPNQSITPKQLQQYFSSQIKFNQKELNDIFCKFDWTRNGFISRKDFLNQIYPKGYKSSNSSTNGILTVQIQALFVELIRQYVSRFRILEVARKEIESTPPYNAFDHICIERKGVIGEQQLKIFLKSNDIDINSQQMEYLIYGLRRRIYTHINLEVFCQNINPLQYGMYETYNNIIRSDQQQNYLRRSRREDEQMRRSRVDTHKIVNEQRKIQRRRIAEMEKQKQISQNLRNLQLQNAERNQRLHRKSLLQTQKRIRWNLEGENAELSEKQILTKLERQRLLHIQAKSRIEQTKNAQLNNNLYENALDLEKQKTKIQYERKLLQQQEMQNNLKKQRILRQAQRQQQQQAIERQLARKRIYQQNLIRQRQNIRKQQELQKIKLRQIYQRNQQRQRLQRLQMQQRIIKQQRLYQQERLLQKQKLYPQNYTFKSNYIPQIQVPLYKQLQQQKANNKQIYQNRRGQLNKIGQRQEQLNIVRNKSRKIQENISPIRTKNQGSYNYQTTVYKDNELDKTRSDLQSKKKRLQQQLKREQLREYKNFQSSYKERQLKKSYLI